MLAIDNMEVRGVIYKLIQHFLRGSLQFTLNVEEINHLTVNVQEVFLRSTIHLDRFKKYPINANFCRMFFKKLITYLERKQEIHDEMYGFLCSSMEKPSECDGVCYRHYVFKNNLNSIVTIKETKNMVIHGTTGMKTWEAAIILADWVLCNKDVLDSKKVLELGSGVGFTGVTIAKHCNISSIIMSDCHNEVLSTIKDNIHINFPDLFEEETSNVTLFISQGKSIGVTMLDWNYISDLPEEIVPDIIFGADIVYDPSILSALCDVLLTFFKRNLNLEVYIASVIRNNSTFEQFLHALDKSGLIYEEIFQLKSVNIEWDDKIERMLLKIIFNNNNCE